MPARSSLRPDLSRVVSEHKPARPNNATEASPGVVNQWLATALLTFWHPFSCRSRPRTRSVALPLTDLLLRQIYLPSHVEILLRNPAGRVSAERAGDLRVADIDVGVMVRRLGRFGYRRHKADSGQEIPELKRLGNRVSAPAPAREIAKLSLDRNVG